MVQFKSQLTRSATSTAFCVALAAVSLACSRESNFDSKAAELDAGAASSGKGTPAQESESARGSDKGGASPGDLDTDGKTRGGKDDPSQEDDGPDEGKETDASDQAVVSELLQLPSKPDSLDLDPNTPDLDKLACQQSFDLKALSKDGSVAPESIRWASSDREVITIDANGTAKVVGPGKVTIVVVGQQVDGTKLQDNIEITIAPAFAGYKIRESEAIKQVTTPSSTQKGSEPPVFVPGLVRGRIRVAAAAKNIDLQSVSATVHSRDFSNFLFSEFTAPKHDPEICGYFVEFKMDFTNFFVADVTRYLGQVLKVTFKPATERTPLNISWKAILVPVSVTAPNPPVVNEGTGVQGFSTDPASSP